MARRLRYEASAPLWPKTGGEMIGGTKVVRALRSLALGLESIAVLKELEELLVFLFCICTTENTKKISALLLPLDLESRIPHRSNIPDSGPCERYQDLVHPLSRRVEISLIFPKTDG